jgi:signal transduction histidine kinase
MSLVETRDNVNGRGGAAPAIAAGQPWLVSTVISGSVEQTDPHSPRTDWTTLRAAEHIVQFYEADACLIDGVAEFILAGLRDGGAGVVVATPAHEAGVRERLCVAGYDVAALLAADQYVPLDAASLLASFTIAGALDVTRFEHVVGAVLQHAGAGGRRVHVFGEMVALLAAAGDRTAAVQLERMWNDVQQRRSFTLFCAYSMQQFESADAGQFLQAVCAEHEHVIPAESFARLASENDRLRAITLLQQKASRLEVEILERTRAEEQLRVALAAEQAARHEAEAALRVRDEFLAIAAHELRTPLTGLSGHAQLILRQLKRHGQLDPQRVLQALEAIAGQTDKLSRLLNQLLDISRLDAGKLTIERQPVDLVALVEEVITAAQARDTQHVLAYDAPETLVALVDPLRVEQVLVNLLDNANKHSPDGGRIEVRITRPASTMLELAIRDSGPGIPLGTRAQIFERYYQAHAQGHKNGLGLGLYISRQIVELHGGDIRAEFPSDGGTRFVVRLPLESASAPTSFAAL